MVFKDTDIQYSNDIFSTIINRVEIEGRIVDHKMFKVYRQEGDSGSPTHISPANKLCFLELIRLDQA